MNPPVWAFCGQLFNIEIFGARRLYRLVEHGVKNSVFNIIGGIDQTDGFANMGMVQYGFGQRFVKAPIKVFFDLFQGMGGFQEDTCSLRCDKFKFQGLAAQAQANWKQI